MKKILISTLLLGLASKTWAPQSLTEKENTQTSKFTTSECSCCSIRSNSCSSHSIFSNTRSSVLEHETQEEVLARRDKLVEKVKKHLARPNIATACAILRDLATYLDNAGLRLNNDLLKKEALFHCTILLEKMANEDIEFQISCYKLYIEMSNDFANSNPEKKNEIIIQNQKLIKSIALKLKKQQQAEPCFDWMSELPLKPEPIQEPKLLFTHLEIYGPNSDNRPWETTRARSARSFSR